MDRVIEIAPKIICLLSLSLIIIVIAVCIRQQRDKREKYFDELRRIFANARKGKVTESEADRFFDYADEAIAELKEQQSLSVLQTTKAEIKEKIGKIEKMSSQITMVLAARSSTASMGDDIDKLANLRRQGIISDHEFQAFSERFKLSTGDKASGIVKAISELHEEHKKGVMSEGNYHAALWSLLDKLDRKT